MITRSTQLIDHKRVYINRKRGDRALEARKYRERHPKKCNARTLLLRALAQGQLFKPENCGDCGRVSRLEAHHEDYSKPLEVRWLCHDCHYQADVERHLRERPLLHNRQDGELDCANCGHKWVRRPHRSSSVRKCPHCKSKYWNRAPKQYRTDIPLLGHEMKTHCKRGHERSKLNVYKDGTCRICQNLLRRGRKRAH